MSGAYPVIKEYCTKSLIARLFHLFFLNLFQLGLTVVTNTKVYKNLHTRNKDSGKYIFSKILPRIQRNECVS